MQDSQSRPHGTINREHPGDVLSEADESVRRVEPLRISTDGGPSVRDPCDVVVEELVSVAVEDVGSYTLMCTPCDVKALAVGFAFSEGIISTIDDCLELTYLPDQHVVSLRVAEPACGASDRSLIVTSSCGMCGSRSIAKYLAGQITSGDLLRVPPSMLRAVTEEMLERQGLFTRTGGAHAAGIFTADGRMIAFAEDIGRHNALDKAVGKCLMQNVSPAGHGLVLSGRVSLELIAKAARANIEIVAAVSAPSSLAIQAARSCNITLCGFVRGRRATVYTHPHRIEDLGSEVEQCSD